jgi:ubiquinone/menaquinone biosynthesis C-methylase UbiE
VEHHRNIAPRAETIWNWDSPAGRVRVERRVRTFVDRAGLRPGRRALEFGCGTGVFLSRVAECGADVVGLDLTEVLLARARERVHGAANVKVVLGNAEASPFPDGAFDAVYGSSILHHLDLDRAVREAFRVLRPGGRLVFTEPNILNPQVVFINISVFKPYFGQSPDEMAFTRFRAKRALERAGFSEVEATPFDFVHPSTPPPLIERVARLGDLLERLPVVREISGSMLMVATRP